MTKGLIRTIKRNFKKMGQIVKKINQGEEYIQTFPKFKRWINECIYCHTKGYDPSMPEQIGEGLGAYYIKKYFNPLSLNKDGICEVCQHLIKKHNKE